MNDQPEKEDLLSREEALRWAYEEFGIASGAELVHIARYIRNED